ncbi:MAG: hypothetical protein J5594_05735 [Elusimicrobiaceae bacterium]|nr:hypothetical protein [Elusimicrobiaceae bacterium]
MNIWAFHRILDAYARAKVDFELCHMVGYDQKLKKLHLLEDKLTSVMFASKQYNEESSNKIRKRITKEND